MANVLYISYTGLLDPLGQGQVLQYLLELAKTHRITLLTFETRAALANDQALDALKDRCRQAGIDWHYLPWASSPLGKLSDMIKGRRLARQLARTNKAQIIHCRSYLAGLVGLHVKRWTGAQFLFDIRGFWPDERADGGTWSRNGWQYRLFKRAEALLFLGADHVVSLTRSAVHEIQRFEYLQGRMPPITVIPTCTNLDLFRPLPATHDGFVLGYVGSVGSWYRFDEVARCVARLFALRPDARFIAVNKGGHDLIRTCLQTAGVDMNRVDIREVPYDQVARQIAEMDAGIFFMKTTWSKTATCPTRMGEFLACGKPCLANGGVGDVREVISETGASVQLDLLGDHLPDDPIIDAAVQDLINLAQSADIAQRCRAVAEEWFSLAGGVSQYDGIYQQMTQKPA